MIVRGTVAVLALAMAAAQLQGCVGAAVGAGATVATAASEERGLVGAARDTATRAEINTLWLDHSEEMLRRLNLDVVEGRVLVTGIVPTTQMRLDAIRLAWQANGVREVINEIKVSDKGGISAYARDSWVTAELKARLLFDKKVQSINYSVETVDGTVYLMGIAQNRDELDRVQSYARTLAYVKQVVSYVRMKGDPRRGAT
jgi:osmotically-inducible protein OsmY